MTVAAFRLTTRDPIDPDTQHALIGLLRQARAGMSHDVETAKHCIDAAASLLGAGGGRVGGGRAGADHSGGLADWQVRRVTAMIEADIAGPLTNADLARVTRLSTNHFARAFRKTFACPPDRYVLQRRIMRSKVLMRLSGEALSQIALDCGFADQAHFCKVFRSLEGEAPTVWRRHHAVPLEEP